MENTHSIIRKTINLLDPVSVMVKKVKAIFANKTAQATFRETFGYTKNYTFSKNEMHYLKLKAAKFILGCLRKISSQQSNVQFKVINGQKVWKMPCFLEKLSSTYDFFLSVSIQKEVPPVSEKACDYHQCINSSNAVQEWYINEGCSHSFHTSCVSKNLPCPLCTAFLS